LLNSTDSMTLKVLFTRPHIAGETKVNARIVGINQIQNFDRIASTHPLSRIVLYCSYVIFLLSTIYLFFSRYEYNFFVKLFYLLLILLISIVDILLITFIASFMYSLLYRIPFFESAKIIINKVIVLIKHMVYEPL